MFDADNKLRYPKGLPKIGIPDYLMYELIDRRLMMLQKFSDLFLVVPVREKGLTGSDTIETKYGQLPVFLSYRLYEMQTYGKEPLRALLLNKNRYKYPTEL